MEKEEQLELFPQYVKKVKAKARLEHWEIAPSTHRLIGQVFNHPERPDGTWVCTTQLVHVDPDYKRAITQNTEYELGERYMEEKEAA